MNRTKIQRKNEEIQHLDMATQEIIHRLNRSDGRLKVSAFVTIIVILAVGVAGIFYQNHLASQNKQHIDCIVKLFTVPLPTSAHSRQIVNPDTTCNIKFSQ